MFHNNPALKPYSLMVLLLVIPLALFWFAGPTPVFGSPSQTFRTLGQLTAILGFVLFAFQFVLAARYQFIENIFSGLNKAYIWHHAIGGFSLGLLMVHPLLLAFQYYTFSSGAVLNFLKPDPNQPAKMLGSIALNGLLFLLILTYMRRLKYETWKKTHKLLGIPFILGFFHLLYVPGMLSQNIMLKMYLTIIGVWGTYSYLLQVIIKPYLLGKRMGKIVAVRQIESEVYEVEIETEGLIAVEAGQFVFLSFISKEVPYEPHPFSITSASGKGTLSVAIKNLGDFTSKIGKLKPGEKVEVEGPYGKFTQTSIANKKQIWIAGGIGITPFISFLRTLDREKKELNDVWLFYSINTSQIPFIKELKSIKLPWFKLVVHRTDKDGRLDIASIYKKLKSGDDFSWVLCGPLPMMRALKSQALKLGIPSNKIHSEEFKLLD